MAELIKDGGFNDGSGSNYWKASARVAFYTNGGRSETATDRCVGFCNESVGGSREIYQKINDFVPGRTYTLSYWAKRRGRYDTWAAYSYYDLNGNYQYINFESRESQLINEVYRQITYTFTIPTNTGRDLWIWIRGGADAVNGTCYLFIDDVSLTGDTTIGSGLKLFDYANTGSGINVRNNYGTSGTSILYETEAHEQFMILNSYAHSDGYTWYLISNQNRRKTNGWIRGDKLTKLPDGMGGKKMFLINPASGSTVNVKKASNGDLLDRWPKGRIFSGTYCDGGAQVRTYYVKGPQPATIVSSYLDELGAYPGIISALIQVCEKEAALGLSKESYGATDPSWDWCQTFANWTAMLAGADWDTRYGINGCTTMMNNINYNYKTRATSPTQPLLGDWVYYDRNGDPNDFEHVGVVVAVSGNTMTTIEGNRTTKVEKFTNLPLYSAPSGSNNVPYYFVSPPFKQ